MSAGSWETAAQAGVPAAAPGDSAGQRPTQSSFACWLMRQASAAGAQQLMGSILPDATQEQVLKQFIRKVIWIGGREYK